MASFRFVTKKGNRIEFNYSGCSITDIRVNEENKGNGYLVTCDNTVMIHISGTRLRVVLPSFITDEIEIVDEIVND